MNRDHFSAGRGTFDLMIGLALGRFVFNVVIPNNLLIDFPKNKVIAAFSLVCLGIDYWASSKKPKERKQKFQTSVELLEKNKNKRMHTNRRDRSN